MPYRKAQLETAPHHAPGPDLTRGEESELFDNYGVAHHRAHGVQEMPTSIAAVDREHIDREHVDRSDDPRDAPRLVRLPDTRAHEGTGRP